MKWAIGMQIYANYLLLYEKFLGRTLLNCIEFCFYADFMLTRQ